MAESSSTTLQGSDDTTTARLDSRFSAPSLDPLSQRAEYDPQSAAIGSAYVSAFNDYVRNDLHYGMSMRYKPSARNIRMWDFRHKAPNVPFAFPRALNVMPDLANAMKYNPNLKVMLNGGYFDLATPFYQGMYEMAHLPMPDKLQANISYHYLRVGAHGVRPYPCAEGDARQRGGVHREYRAPASGSGARRSAIDRTRSRGTEPVPRKRATARPHFRAMNWVRSRACSCQPPPSAV